MPKTAKKAKKKIDDVALIFAAIQTAKNKSIRRIVRQFERMSPQDVQQFERLIGKR